MIYIKIKIKDITVKGIKRIDKDISGMEKFKDKIFHSHSRQKSCFTLGFVAKIVSYGKYYK